MCWQSAPGAHGGLPDPGRDVLGRGAIGNARWTGVPLREILLAAGVEEGTLHVAFTGLDEIEEGYSPNYGSSIPLKKGTGSEVLLAYEMNDESLRPEHGFPLRAVVPGYIGARSVKWLSRIALQDTPSDNYFQAWQYKLFPPYVTEEPDDVSKGFALGEISVNAVTCRPTDGATIQAGLVTLQGYAIAGGGRDIERVDLSPDEGQTWVGATLSEVGIIPGRGAFGRPPSNSSPARARSSFGHWTRPPIPSRRTTPAGYGTSRAT